MDDFKDCTDESVGLGLILAGPPTADPLEDTRALAERGDGAAAKHLGDCYREGDPLPFGPRRAFRWYVRGAFTGHPSAMNNLGACYHNGFGCVRNMKQAIHWYTQGALRGCPHAQENLGRCYLKGDGVPTDRNRAIQWLRKAARQDHEKARKTLIEMDVPVYPASDQASNQRDTAK